MPATNVTLEVIVGCVAVGQVIIGALLWAVRTAAARDMADLENRLMHHMDECYVRSGECVLRDTSIRETVRANQETAAASCLAAAARDETTQARIDDLVRSIAARAADTILRDREILSKIDKLLLRK